VPRLCGFYPGICVTTEEKAWEILSQGKKNLSQFKKNLSQSTVYILPKTPTRYKTHPHTHTHTLSLSLSLSLQNLHTPTPTQAHTHTLTHTHTHTLQNNIKPPQYKFKLYTQCTIINGALCVQFALIQLFSFYARPSRFSNPFK